LAQVIDTQHVLLASMPRQIRARIGCCRVFDDGSNDVLFFRKRFDDAANGQIIGFGAARRKNNFFARTPQKPSNLCTSFFDGCFRPFSVHMAARWIAKTVHQPRHHRFEYLEQNGCRRVVVEVNRIVAVHGVIG
jgi:hypothetical protein